MRETLGGAHWVWPCQLNLIGWLSVGEDLIGDSGIIKVLSRVSVNIVQEIDDNIAVLAFTHG